MPEKRITPPRASAARIAGAAIAVLVWVGFLATAGFLQARKPTPEVLTHSQLRDAIDEGRVRTIALSEVSAEGELRAAGATDGAPRPFTVRLVEDPGLVPALLEAGVSVERGAGGEPGWGWLLLWIVPFALLLLWSIGSFKRGSRPGETVAGFGRSRAKVYVEKEIAARFTDVAGVDEAIAELREVVEFLSHPEKYRRLGGKIPKGILLAGPPGTGKTLLARAVAGEAAVPFFNISGSEFVELFVGVGAARVRDLFAQAKEKAPCIIFIDELDALGKVRGLGPNMHEEREQTLNQLLVEMDGFDPRAGVILMAATNRPEILDPALLRAGRFDRHVLVDRPDRIGRRAILAVHVRNVPLEPGVDLDAIAGMTAGLVGADLANLVNEGTLIAVRRGKDTVGNAELMESLERVIAGMEKKSRLLTPAEKERVAHHEIGHALVAQALPGPDVIRKISVIPRGIAALGYTLQLPTEDRFLLTQTELENRLAVLLGGRVAEEIVYGDVSTGAQDDLRKATDIAQRMVRSYGMSRKLGQLSFEREPSPLFLGPPAEPEYGPEVAREIDAEVRWIVEQQHARAKRILATRKDVLVRAALELVRRESLSGAELAQISEDVVAEGRSREHGSVDYTRAS